MSNNNFPHEYKAKSIKHYGIEQSKSKTKQGKKKKNYDNAILPFCKDRFEWETFTPKAVEVGWNV